MWGDYMADEKTTTNQDRETAAPSTPSAATVSATNSKETPQQEFDRLTERKKELWLQVKDRDPAIRELTPEWEEIQRLDKRMLDLWRNFDIKREED